MIKPSEYKFISDNLGTAHAEAEAMYSAMGDMLNHLADNELSNVSVQKQILQEAITETYFIVYASHVQVTEPVKRMVTSLHQHIKREYASVDAFLQAKGIKVSAAFAELSALCGYEISAQNLE